jgi:hypothetical protein
MTDLRWTTGLILLSLASAATARADEPKPVTLKAVLLESLRLTHGTQDWFVPAKNATAGLTPAQASWTDKSGNHSIGQLANHLLFWDRNELTKFKGEKPPAFSGNNDETFNNFDAKSWNTTVTQLDAVMTEWEKAVEAADDKKVAEWASRISHVATHNAYHVGQMMYVRKLQGAWDAKKGVK